MGHALHQSNVMADKAYGKALLSLKFNDQIDYIFLYGYIQCCRCLIQNQDLRLEGQRPGNCYPLPLTAAHAVRETVFKISGQLLQDKGTIVSREKLMEALWQTDSFVDENTLSVNMARLRKKLDGAGLTGFITTKIGAGYLVE